MSDAKMRAARRLAAENQPAVEDQPKRDAPATVAATLERVDRYWRAFRALVARYPRERIDEPLGRSWTRKQMLAHVAAWHDLSTQRLLDFQKTGRPQPLADEVDTINARVARVAVGRTSGEVVDAVDASFNRLRRQISQLTDEQLAEHDGWAAQLIAGNTYEHYDEHVADLRLVESEPPSGRR